jgi:hypothetical protein
LGGRQEVSLEVWLEHLAAQVQGLQSALLCQFWGLRPGPLLVLCLGDLWLVQLQEQLPAQPLMDSCLTDMSGDCGHTFD